MDEKLNDNLMEIINLNIGELVILEKQPKVVHTLLGSCVSIIFYVPNSVAMISHAQMPSNHEGTYICKKTCPKFCGRNYNNKSSFRYVTCSLEYMINYAKVRGIKPESIHVSLLGGASVLDTIDAKYSVGDLNIQTAMEIFNKYKMKVSRQLTGGTSGMSLWYYSDTNRLEIMKHGDRIKFEL